MKRDMKMRKPLFWKNYHLMDKKLYDMIQFSSYLLIGTLSLCLLGFIFSL